MPTGMQSSYTGISSIDNIPADMRIYGRTGDILKLTKGRLSFSKIFTNKLQQKGKTAVTDITFKYKSDLPRQPLLAPVLSGGVYSDAGTNTLLYVSKAEAVMVEPGATLMIEGVWLRNNGGTLTYETTMGAGHVAGVGGATSAERALVLAVSAPDGNDVVTLTVQRGFGNPYGLSNGTPCAISATMQYVLLPKSQTVGSNEGKVYGDTPYEEENNCEINFEKWGITNTSRNISFYQNQDALERNGERQLDNYWKKFEMRQVFGVKGSSQDAEGEFKFFTGTIDQYIETSQSAIKYVASEHIINFKELYGPVSSISLNNFGQNLFWWGSQTKWWIMDSVQYTKITNAFDNKIRINKNVDMSMAYGFEINELLFTGGGRLLLALSDAFSMYGLSNLGYILDFDYFKHVHLQNEDFMILTNVEKGMNVFKTVNYLYMNSGLYRTCPFAHMKVYNL